MFPKHLHNLPKYSRLKLNMAISPIVLFSPGCTPDTRSNDSSALNWENCVYLQVCIFMSCSHFSVTGLVAFHTCVSMFKSTQPIDMTKTSYWLATWNEHSKIRQLRFLHGALLNNLTNAWNYEMKIVTHYTYPNHFQKTYITMKWQSMVRCEKDIRYHENSAYPTCYKKVMQHTKDSIFPSVFTAKLFSTNLRGYLHVYPDVLSVGFLKPQLYGWSKVSIPRVFLFKSSFVFLRGFYETLRWFTTAQPKLYVSTSPRSSTDIRNVNKRKGTARLQGLNWTSISWTQKISYNAPSRVHNQTSVAQ